MKAKRPIKPYWEMSLEELRDATKEYDKPIPARKLRPMNADERARFERARQGPHRSIYILRHSGKSKTVTFKLDAHLLQRSADYAAKHRMTLEQFVARSLQGTLIAAG